MSTKTVGIEGVEQALVMSPDAEVLDEELVQQIKKKSVAGAISYTLRQIIVLVINLVAMGLLAGYLTTEQFGAYGIVILIIGLLTFFSDIGFASALIQKKEEPTLTEYRTVFTIQQILSWCIFGTTVAIALSHVLFKKIGADGELVLMVLGFSFPLTTLKTIPSVMLERKLEFSKIVIPHIVEELSYNSIVVWCAIAGFGTKSFAIAILVRSLAGVATMLCLKQWPIGFSLNMAAFQEMVKVGAKFQLNDLLSRLKDQLADLVFALFIPTSQFGYVTFGAQFSILPYQLTVQNVVAITFPTYSRLQNDQELLKKAIEKTIFFITLLIFPMLVGMCIFIIPLTHLTLPIVGTKYHKWQPAILTFVLLTLSLGWAAISTPLTNTLNVLGHINTTLKLMVMWIILTWVLTPIAMYFFGFNGVAIAEFLISFTSVIPMYLVKKIVDIQIWENVWRQFLSAVVMAGVGIAFLSVWSRNLPWMLAGMVIVSLVYFAVLMMLGRQRVVAEVQSLRSRMK